MKKFLPFVANKIKICGRYFSAKSEAEKKYRLLNKLEGMKTNPTVLRNMNLLLEKSKKNMSTVVSENGMRIVNFQLKGYEIDEVAVKIEEKLVHVYGEKFDGGDEDVVGVSKKPEQVEITIDKKKKK